MATRSGDKDLENGIKVALDAADTASGVTEEFNNVREQFEVVNIQADLPVRPYHFCKRYCGCNYIHWCWSFDVL